jgi:RNA polymerase sigma-70 factor (ECF subfamily)
VAATPAAQAAEDAARRSYGKLVAFLSARTRDVAAAEDAFSEAFAAALADWPVRGIPDSPEAWLLTVARRRQVDRVRESLRGEAAAQHLLLLQELAHPKDDQGIPDERLRLMFACAHPAIDPAVRAPLMLQAVLGLDAATIGSAFLVAPAAMGQRLVRAKHKIRQAGIPFRVPERGELAERTDAVLDAIYAAFAEGWTATGAADLERRDLAEEALFLGRLIAELLPGAAEALGLLSLMLYASARRDARRADGEYVPLAAQDPARWDAAMIDEAEALLRRAAGLGAIGRFQLEAALQSAHTERRRSGHDNRVAVLVLYDGLLALTASPVVALNRALAIADLDGPEAATGALAAIDSLYDPRLRDYQPYWAARAEVLARVGRVDDAHRAYERAIGLEADEAVRCFLRRRQAALVAGERG